VERRGWKHENEALVLAKELKGCQADNRRLKLELDANTVAAKVLSWFLLLLSWLLLAIVGHRC
jgi:hypothetical protein